MASLLPNAKQQFLDASGRPLAGGTVGFFIPNTTTPKDTWQDAAGTILNTNPVRLDAAGEAIIYGSGTYRQIVKDRHGNLIWDQITDDLTAQITTAINGVKALLTAPNITYTGDGAGDVATNLQVMINAQPVSLWRFLTAAQITDAMRGTLSLDCTMGIQNWLNYCVANKRRGYAPAGSYLTGAISLDTIFVPTVVGDGALNTIFQANNIAAGTAMFTLTTPVSSNATQPTWEGMRFQSAPIGIQVRGLDNLTIRDCAFVGGNVGLSLNNFSAGLFTENVVADRCYFTLQATHALEYIIGPTGDQFSFHEAGLINNCVVQMSNSAQEVVFVGPGAAPYQAPLDMTVFLNAAVVPNLINRQNAQLPPDFYGCIRIEGGNTGQSFIGANAYVPFMGNFHKNGAGSLGQLVRYDTLHRATSGVVIGMPSPFSTNFPNIVGVCNIYNISNYIGVEAQVIIASGSGPQYFRLDKISAMNGGGTQTNCVLTNIENLDGAGYGPPTYIVTAGGVLQLILPAAMGANTASVTAGVLPTGPSPFADPGAVDYPD